MVRPLSAGHALRDGIDAEMERIKREAMEHAERERTGA